MFSSGMLKKAFSILSQEGLVVLLIKSFRFFYSKVISRVGGLLYETNSRNYWDFRMRWDWGVVGGGAQTQLLAASLFANVPKQKFNDVSVVLDYGCATGDSAIIIRIFLPNSSVMLHDFSRVGVEKGVAKYSRFLPVKIWNGNDKADLVYCSNVIEHVEDPAALVNELISSSRRYIIVQCPENERHSDGSRLSKQCPAGEHVWTVDDEFFKEFIRDPRVRWEKFTGIVPMAWEGGVQVYYFGTLVPSSS
jgi:SAM-dependent methyltransferase